MKRGRSAASPFLASDGPSNASGQEFLHRSFSRFGTRVAESLSRQVYRGRYRKLPFLPNMTVCREQRAMQSVSRLPKHSHGSHL